MNKNNLYQRGLIVPVLLGVIVVLIVGGGVYFYKNKKIEAPIVENENGKAGLNNQQEVVPVDTTAQDANTKSFKLGTLEFSYPNNLSYGASGGIPVISLSHSIPFKHVNSCDLKDGSSLNDAIDFSVSFKLVYSDLNNTIKKDNPNMIEYIFKGDTIVISSGWVDKYKIGLLDGYRITSGVEGCGFSVYYFPISKNETLLVRRDAYLQTLQMEREKLINIPGFITSVQEEQIFKDILSSVTGVSLQQETMTVKLYFGNRILNPEMLDCRLVYPVNRVIPYTKAVATATLNELIKGPTPVEEKKGYFSSIPNGTKANSVKMVGDTLYIDFNEIAAGGGGSCGQALKGNSIGTTLRQFSTIKNIEMTINGKGETADLFQP